MKEEEKMNETKRTGVLKSTNGKTNLTYFVYEPQSEPKAMIQIAHGMSEYVERYEPLIDYLVQDGFLVFGNNHLGHKGSVASEADLGFLGGTTQGWKYMYQDIIQMGELMKEQYPQLKLFLHGHSMGSFLARAVMVNKPQNYDGVILCGTSGSNPAIGMGKVAVKIVSALRGNRARSALLTKLFCGTYNSKYEKIRTSEDWLTRDNEIVDHYRADKYCSFVFTANGYLNLVELLEYVTSDDWYDKVPTDLPIFMISGEMDPVGGWGKGIREVDEKLRQKPRADYRMKLYPQMRHEIHNEIGKEEVYADILNWYQGQLV